MKKILILSLASILIASPISAFATTQTNIESRSLLDRPRLGLNDNNWILLTKSNEEYILLNTETGEKACQVHETVDGVTKKLSAEEALDRFNGYREVDVNSFQSDETNKIESRAEIIFTRTHGPENVQASYPIKISHDVVGPAKLTVSQGVAATVTESFSADLTYGEKTKVRAGAGVSWSQSSNRSVSSMYEVAAGKIGYVGFKPYYYYIEGVVINQLASGIQTSSKKTGAMTPKVLNGGLCDGLEYLIYK